MSDNLRRAIVLIVVLAAAAGAYYWQRGLLPGGGPAATPQAEVQTLPAQPLIRHPVPSPAAAGQPQLPALAASDKAAGQRLADLVGPRRVAELFHVRELIRRIVVTVDNLTQPRLSERYAPLKPAHGEFQVKPAPGGGQVIGPGNYTRYTPYVRLAEAVDVHKLVDAYSYFYPLFQEAYGKLGYRERYFNDRLIEVIDSLLNAPEIESPVKVVQPGVFYQFADPKLEALPAGQKIMVRMGPANAARVKARLRDLRRALVALGGGPFSP